MNSRITLETKHSFSLFYKMRCTKSVCLRTVQSQVNFSQPLLVGLIHGQLNEVYQVELSIALWKVKMRFRLFHFFWIYCNRTVYRTDRSTKGKNKSRINNHEDSNTKSRVSNSRIIIFKHTRIIVPLGFVQFGAAAFFPHTQLTISKQKHANVCKQNTPQLCSHATRGLAKPRKS